MNFVRSGSALSIWTRQLWDGTSVWGAAYATIPAVASAAVNSVQLCLTGIAAPTSTDTFEVSCTSNAGSQVIEAAPGYQSPGNYATTLTAVRLK